MGRKKLVRKLLTAFLAVALVFTSVDVTAFVSYAVENAFEATSGTHGATYDASSNQVTFFVNSSDAFYGQVNHMWYKEYASYEEAAAAHISNGGNFIASVGATAMTANADNTQKTVTRPVSEGTGAILYYINGEAGHARPDFEHIIVIGNSGAGSTETPDVDENEGTDTPVMTGDPHGATYDAENKKVTFFVQNNDAFYGQTEFMWYKEYATVAEAEAAHISNGGNFIDGVGATNLAANAEGTVKSVTVSVADTTAAIVYYFNAGAGHARPDYEHVLVIKNSTVTPEEGGNEGGNDDNPTTSEYINLEEKAAAENGVWTFVATDVSDATFSYEDESVTVNASGWGQQDWWSVQWTVQDIDVTAGNWNVEYDIVSTINKPVLSKLTNFGSGDQDTPIIEAKYDLTANETKHYSETATIGADGKVRLFFNLAGGTGAGSVTISNIAITPATGNEDVEDPDKDDEEVKDEVVANAITFDNIETSFYRSQDDGGWAGDSNATVKYDGTKAVVSADSFGWNAWGIQWKLLGLTSEEETNTFEFDVVSSINKTINVKVETTGEMETITLVAGEPYHYEKEVASNTVDITFDLVGGEGAGSLIFTNVEFGTCGNTSSSAKNAIVFENVTTEFYRSQDDGGWAGDSNATVKYDGTTAVVSADSFGWNAWGIQWKLKGLASEEETNTFAFDVVSTINKSINVKNENSGEMETITLVAGETYHYEKEVASKTVDITFDLVGGEGAGSLTFTNMTFGTGSATDDKEDDSEDVNLAASTDPLNFEELTIETYCSQNDGGWAGDSNVAFKYSGTTALITADNFGWNAWGIQWMIKNLTSSVDNNVFEFEVESSIDKTIVYKNEETAKTETLTLKAGEKQRFAFEVEGKTLNATFDLTGGAKAGSLTFTNMKFGPMGVIEVAPALEADRALDKSNGYKLGQDVTLKYDAEATAWAEKISAVKVNNQAVSADAYSAVDGVLTIAASVFNKENVYKIEVDAEGFGGTDITVPVYASDVANENWSVAWEDQFNGTALDTSKWSYEIGIQSGEDGNSSSPTYWGNNEKQYYTKEAIEVKDGYLVITGDKLTQDVKNQYNVTDSTVQYTSGRIRTVTDSGEVLAATTYGRIEAKMSLPASDGYWPAFWMLPTPETCELYGTWASSGELDIMEAVGQNGGQVNGTIHYGGNWPNNVYHGGTYVFPENENIAGEHVYAVEWEPGEIRWYVDDILYHVENNWYGMDANGEKYSYPAPFDEDFYILFNLAMSGNYVANVMPTEMGKQMKVDYVRILTDSNTDYNASVTAPSSDRDTAFFEANGGYVDLIQDKDYTTLADHAFGDGANVIPGIGYWSSAVNTGAGANATVAVVDGAAKIDVTKVGAQNYNIQLIQNMPLAKGYTYRITFDAWTDLTSGRAILVAPKGDADNSWAAYDAGINAALTTNKKTFTYEFLMTADSDPTARLEMNLGGATGSVYVDNVSVIALTDEQLEGNGEVSANEPLANGEHIYNGAFDKGTGKLGNWTTEGSVGSAANREYTVTVGEEGAKLIQTGLQLLAEDTYKVTFDAKEVKEFSLWNLLAGKDAAVIRASVVSNDDAVTYVTRDFELTDATAAYELEFTVPEGKGTDLGKLVFEFVGTDKTMTIDNVSMKRLTNVHMEWDAYEFYPIGKNNLDGFSTYDEVWTWTENPVSATNIGNGEMALKVSTAPASESWKVMLQKKGALLSEGMTYRIGYAIKASAANKAVEVKIEDTSYSPCYKENLTVGTEWTYVDTTFVSTLPGAGDLKFCLAGVDAACDIFVKDVNIELSGLPTPQFAIGSEVTEMTVGDAIALDIEHSVKVQAKYDSFTYASSDSDIIEVAADGTMTAKAEGTATITVTSVLGTSFSFAVEVLKDEDDKEDDGEEGKDDSEDLDKDYVNVVVGKDVPEVKVEIDVERILDEDELSSGTIIETVINTFKNLDKDEDSAVKNVIKTELGNNAKEVANYDIDLFKVLNDDDREQLKELTVTSIEITLDIPDELIPAGLLKKDLKFSMIRLHEIDEGELEGDVLADIDDSEETITFVTDRFSTYVLVYEKDSTPESSGGSDEITKPGNSKPAQSNKPAHPNKPAKPAEPAKPGKPAEHSKPAKPGKAKPVQVVVEEDVVTQDEVEVIAEEVVTEEVVTEEVTIQDNEVPKAAFDDMIEVDNNTNNPILLIVLIAIFVCGGAAAAIFGYKRKSK